MIPYAVTQALSMMSALDVEEKMVRPSPERCSINWRKNMAVCEPPYSRARGDVQRRWIVM